MYKLHRNHQSRTWAGWCDYARLLLHHHTLLAEMQQGWRKRMAREEGRHFDQHLQNWRRKKKKRWWKENTKKVADKICYNREIKPQDQLQHFAKNIHEFSNYFWRLTRCWLQWEKPPNQNPCLQAIYLPPSQNTWTVFLYHHLQEEG